MGGKNGNEKGESMVMGFGSGHSPPCPPFQCCGIESCWSSLVAVLKESNIDSGGTGGNCWISEVMKIQIKTGAARGFGKIL